MRRINFDEALSLLETSDLLSLGKSADKIRQSLHPEGLVTFIIDRNINYTNICVSGCKFCAFYKKPGDKNGYLLSKDEIFKKIDETLAVGGTQILMQGGLNPKLSLAYFEELFSSIKKRYKIRLHALSPSEIHFIAKNASLPLREALIRLKNAGLDSIPGGGAEILVNEIRGKISPDKIKWEEWRDVMVCAHSLEIPTTATMMFGSKESYKDIILHLFRIREIQDKTSGFTAFIPWTYQPGNTELGGVAATAYEYLKVLSIARIVLDNIKNIQASWVTQGLKIAQASLFFGANDIGSTMLEENVVSATGISFKTNKDELISIIKDAGFLPAERDTVYNILKYY